MHFTLRIYLYTPSIADPAELVSVKFSPNAIENYVLYGSKSILVKV